MCICRYRKLERCSIKILIYYKIKYKIQVLLCIVDRVDKLAVTIRNYCQKSLPSKVYLYRDGLGRFPLTFSTIIAAKNKLPLEE